MAAPLRASGASTGSSDPARTALITLCASSALQVSLASPYCLLLTSLPTEGGQGLHLAMETLYIAHIHVLQLHNNPLVP